MSPGGRPEIGQPINIRLGDALPLVDAYAARMKITRAQALRAIVKAALAELDDDTIEGY